MQTSARLHLYDSKDFGDGISLISPGTSDIRFWMVIAKATSNELLVYHVDHVDVYHIDIIAAVASPTILP